MSIVLIEMFNPILTVIRVKNEYYKDAACILHAYFGDIHGNVPCSPHANTMSAVFGNVAEQRHTGYDR